MADQPRNNFLKDTNTISILPAPPETRQETGVSWYEVQIIPVEKTVRLLAFGKQGDQIGIGKVRLIADRDVEFTLSEKEFQLATKLSLAKTESGQMRINVFGDEEFDIEGATTDPQSARVSGRRRVAGAEKQLPTHWGRLVDPLVTLAEALTVRAVDSHSWGCSSCLLLGSAVVLGSYGCAKGAIPACVGALSSGGVFLENCEGACHHLIE